MRGARMPGLSAGSAMRKRHVVLLLFIGATAAVWISFAPRYAAPLSAAPERTAQRAETQEARTAALPLREALGKLRGEVFADRSPGAPPAAPTHRSSVRRAPYCLTAMPGNYFTKAPR